MGKTFKEISKKKTHMGKTPKNVWRKSFQKTKLEKPPKQKD